MGNKVVVKYGASKELTPQGLRSSEHRVALRLLHLALALLKASSSLSEDGKEEHLSLARY